MNFRAKLSLLQQLVDLLQILFGVISKQICPLMSPIIRRFSSYSSTSSPFYSPSTSPILKHHKVKRLLLNNTHTHSINRNNSNNNKNKNNENDINNENKTGDENNSENKNGIKNDDDNRHKNENSRNLEETVSGEKNDEIICHEIDNTDFDATTEVKKNMTIDNDTSSSFQDNLIKKTDCGINDKNEMNVSNSMKNNLISKNKVVENNFENKNKIEIKIKINIENNIDDILNDYMNNCSPQKPDNSMRNQQKIDYEKEYEKEIEKESQKEIETENEKESQKENENEKLSGTNSVECFQTYVTVVEKAYKLICLRLAISCSHTLKENENFLIINEDSNSRCSKNVPVPLAEQILQNFKLSDLFFSNCPSLPVSTFGTLGADIMYTSRDDDVVQSSRTISTSRSESRSGSIATINLPCNVHDYRKQNNENLKSVLSIMKTLHLLVVRSWKHTDNLPNRLFRNKNSRNNLPDLKT